MKKIIVLAVALLSASSCMTTKPPYKDNIAPVTLEQFLTAQHGYIKIPLSRLASGHLHLDANVNGVPGSFILDTGAAATVIEASRKDTFHLVSDASQNVGAGAGGQVRMQTSQHNKFTLGTWAANDMVLYTMDLSHVNNSLQTLGIDKVDGVIGADILSRAKGVIDYPNLTLYVKTPSDNK